MCHRRSSRYAALVLLFVACGVQLAFGQQSINMPGVENSVGFLTTGTSIEPRTTSESSPMIHRSLGDWTFMFHANAFLADIQQSGPRGHDKLFSTNWLMPMVTRQLGRQTLTLRTMHNGKSIPKGVHRTQFD